MSKNFIDRKHDEEIIDIVNCILSNAKFEVETINEAILVKLMELRGTPIKYDKSFRNIDKDFERWQIEKNIKSFTAKQVADMLVKDFATIEDAIAYFDTVK